MQKAVGYVRVSTQEQAREGVSLDAQTDRIRAYATLAGLDLVGIIREEGVSASKPLATRDGGADVVRMLAKGEAAHVIALKLDRLFRDSIDALTQTRAWDRKGVALHLVDFGGQALNSGSATGRFFLAQLASIAELERNLIGERTAQALAHKKAKREAYSPTPYGFDRVGDRLVENPKEQGIVSRIRDLADAGESFRGIARTLNLEGISTKRQGSWHARTVAYLLRNTLHAQERLEAVA